MPPSPIDDTGFAASDLAPVLLLGGLVVLVGVAAVRLANRSGLPTLVIYLALGLLLGEAGLGIQFSSADLAQALGYGMLVLILAEGGMTTRFSEIRGSLAPAAVLSTVGVAVSVLTVAAGCVVLLDMPWELALLMGSVISSTDAAAVFSILRGVSLPRRVSATLEAESGINDAPVALLVAALSANLIPNAHIVPWYEVIALASVELVLGGILGVGLGWVGGKLLSAVASSSSALLAIGAVTVPVVAYAVTVTLHGSGFLAAYTAGLVIGNMRLPHGPAVRGFAQASGSLAQIGLFVMLGLLASPKALPGAFAQGLVAGAVLLLVARPLSVVVSLLGQRFPWREQVFLSWAGLRGAVPIVLATVPIAADVPGAENYFNIVFVLVLVLTLVQTSTMGWLARRLGLTSEVALADLEVEAVPLMALDADLLQVTVTRGSLLHGTEVRELQLPAGAHVTMIVRGKEMIVPSQQTRLRHGDQLLVVSTESARGEAERTLRAVSRFGRLAGWRRTPPASE